MAAEMEHPPTNEQEERRKSRVVPRWVVIGALVIFAGVVIVLVYGYLARPGWIGVSNKTFWDYLELLIVPAALAIGVYLLNRAQESERQAQEAHREHERAAEAEQRERERAAEAEQRERERAATEEARRERERLAQEAQRERELAVANLRAQDAALQAYLDQMSHLLTDAERPLHRAQPGDTLSIVARARTLTVLPRLDPDRKARVLQFLYESGVIAKERPVLDLRGADFSAATLGGPDLFRPYLLEADLSGAYLREAYLRGADLRGTTLREANLIEANLEGADLEGADLRGARVWTDDQLDAYRLDAAKSLKGATMPDGQKYEDWLKSKDRKEGGKNDGSS